MAAQQQIYTLGIVGQAMTMTPKVGSESRPTHLGASTIVFNTVQTTPDPDFWKASAEYLITVEVLTKSAP
jgi:hypothetical protein